MTSLGISPDNRMIKLDTTAIIASAIAGAPVVITPAKATIPSPIFVKTCGMRFATSVIAITSRPIAAVPPADKAAKPAPNKTIPAPIAKTATPNKAIAAAKANITGVRGANIAAAAPITANAATRTTIPFAIPSQDKAPMTTIAEAKTNEDAAITSIAAAPTRTIGSAVKIIAATISIIATPRPAKP